MNTAPTNEELALKQAFNEGFQAGIDYLTAKAVKEGLEGSTAQDKPTTLEDALHRIQRLHDAFILTNTSQKWRQERIKELATAALGKLPQ